MKKLITILVALTIVVASCSKEKKLNKKLDGTWNLTSFKAEVFSDGKSMGIGELIVAGNTATYTFGQNKKDNGTFVGNFYMYGKTSTNSGTYTLEKDESITFTNDASKLSEVYKIVSYSKTDITFKKPDGYDMVLKKK